MSFQFLSFEPDADGLALITINRPAKMNALNRTLLAELDEAFRTAREDSAIKGVILTGAGEKAFIAGADIAELAEVDAIEAAQMSRRGQETFRALETLRKPSVAAINGVALGGGLELAMCCTIRLATPNAKLGQPEVKLGTGPRLWRHTTAAETRRPRTRSGTSALRRTDRRGRSASHRPGECRRRAGSILSSASNGHSKLQQTDRWRSGSSWKLSMQASTADWTQAFALNPQPSDWLQPRQTAAKAPLLSSKNVRLPSRAADERIHQSNLR